MAYFDIYGFRILVDGPASDLFSEEFGFFSKKKINGVDLHIKPSVKNLPTKQKGSKYGVKIPFGERDNLFLYNPQTDSSFILYMAEPLIRWKDKCFLHCGAVSVDNKATIFPAWSGVGKTRIVMSLIRRGYKYLSDDWLVLSKDEANPYPRRMHIFDYNLRDKKLAKRVLGKRYYFYTPIFRILRYLEAHSPSRFVNILIDRFRPSFSVPLQAVEPKAEISKSSRIERIVFLSTGRDLQISATELAEKMATVNLHELNHFYLEYQRYKFLNRESSKIENMYKHDVNILKKVFSTRKIEILNKGDIGVFLSNI